MGKLNHPIVTMPGKVGLNYVKHSWAGAGAVISGFISYSHTYSCLSKYSTMSSTGYNVKTCGIRLCVLDSQKALVRKIPQDFS